MLDPITEAEIQFMEHFYSPANLIETLVPENWQAPQHWPVSDTIYLRSYQHAMLNYSYIYADDPKKSKFENFRIKKMVGDGYHFGSRETGKSYMLIIDVILSIIHGIKEGIVVSDCASHLKKITEPIANFMESHKFLKIFHLKDSRANTVKRDYLTITSETGTVIRDVNEKSDTDKAGDLYQGKHSETRWYEENSFSSTLGNEKAIGAVGNYGRIERLSGIPDLCIGSPMGKILQNKNLKPWIWQLPQYVKMTWNDKIEQEKIEAYKGANSASYRLNVLAETVEGAFGFFDMERLREASEDKGKRVKYFEVGKENFSKFEQSLIVERMAGTKKCFIAADLGFGAAPTEIIIIFFDGKKYKYVYNIPLFRLSPEEQPDIFYWLYHKLGGAYISLDSTSDNSAMIERLAKKGIPRDHLLAVRFNENIEIGFEKDEEDNVLVDKFGDPIMKEMYCETFSYQEMERLFYSGEMRIPSDEKFLNQFTNIICKQTKTRPMFDSKGENHLVQSWQVWSISRFLNEFNTMKNTTRRKRGWGAF